MPLTTDRIEMEAITWHVLLRDGTAEDWERFTSWLEEDPLHARIYDEVVLADLAVEALPPKPARQILPPDGEARSSGLGRRIVIGWGIAAALVGSLGYLALPSPEDSFALETGLGQRRTQMLADGSRIDLNGSTRLVLDKKRPRFVRLIEGEALFTITPDRSNPFVVQAGGSEIRVLGTIFNTVASSRGVEVAVAEGVVLFEPDTQAIRLTAGRFLHKRPERPILVGRQDEAAVGSWREGRLIYSSAPISTIAADLSRNLGVPVRADPQTAGRTFSGVIILDPDRDRLFRRVSALLSIDARRSGEGWILTADARH